MLYLILNYLRDLLRPNRDLLLENMALRQQIIVLRRTHPKPPFSTWERVFWVVLSKVWSGWRRPLTLVKPETVITWHRMGWRLFWRRKCRNKEVGRPRIPYEVIALIKRMSRENPTWGAPRIHSELEKLGYWVCETTVGRYMLKRRGRPTQNWKTFIRNHLDEMVAIDFLTVPTITFRTLYVFVLLSLDRRRMIHFNVTDHPNAEWTALQLIQAFPFDAAPKYLIRGRDGIYGEMVVKAIESMGIEEKVISARSPWQNGYCERVVGTLNRECLNHMIILNERHCFRVIKSYLEYYHRDRTHIGLGKDTPDGRPVEPPSLGPVKRRPMVGGLHSRYYRDAA